MNQSHADMKFLKALAEPVALSAVKEHPFMVLTQTEFKKMTPEHIQSVFRSKHIIVTGIEHDHRMKFDRRGFERVGNWDELRTLQGSLFSLTIFTCADFVRLVC